MAKDPQQHAAGKPWGTAFVSLVVAIPLMVWLEVSVFRSWAGPPLPQAETTIPPPSTSGPGAEAIPPPPTSYTTLSEIPEVFNPVTGEPQVWFSGEIGKSPRFFTSPGYDPSTGEPLRPVSRDLLDDYTEGRDRAKEREAARAAMREREAAERREREYRARYLNEGTLQGLGGASHTLIAISDHSFATALGEALSGRGHSVRLGVLTPAALEGEVLSGLQSGNRGLLSRLTLSEISGTLVVGTVSFETKAPGRLTSVKARLSASVVPLKGGTVRQLSLAESGAGFDSGSATENARERLLASTLEHPAFGR